MTGTTGLALAAREHEVAEDWRLRDEHGELRTLTTQQLRDGLAEGTIPSSVLVARGTKEFQPAFSVPELATAAIRAKRTPSIPPTGSTPAPSPAVLRPAPPRVALRTPKPAAVEVPAPPRSRRRIAHTLVGIQGDEEGLPPSEVAPIVAPGSGGGARKAITQVPRYTPAPQTPSSVQDDAVVIPRAPRAPGALGEGNWDGQEVKGAEPSIFDGEEDAQTLVQKDDPSSRKAPARPPGPPPKVGERRPSSHHPPPLPPRRDAAAGPARPPLRNTVMGLGTSGAPRLVAPKEASTPPPAPVRASTSTPPPAAARPVSRPPGPPPKKTPAPPQVAQTPAPAQVAAQTPAPSGVASPVEPTGGAGAIVGAPTAATPESRPSDAKPSEAPGAEAQPTFEGTPTVPMPEAREAQRGLTAEGTPTVPMPEARESVADVDEAPTSKMQVQIVHGAALAMRAALAAPHFDTAPSASEAVPPVSSVPPVQEASSPAIAAASSVSGSPPEAMGSSPPLAPEPSPGTTLRGVGPSSSPPPARISEPPVEEEEEPAPPSGVEVPVSSLFAASAVWIIGLVSVFFVGRCSALEARPESARRGIATTTRLAMLAAAPGGAGSSEPKPCWVTRQPSRWAPQASRNVPFEMVAMPGGSALLVGYGLSDEKGLGLRVDPKSGKFETIHEETIEAGIARVTPLPGKTKDDAPTFLASPRAETTLVPVPGADPPLFVRFSKGEIATLDAADAAGTTAFSLEGEERPNTEQVLTAGPAGFYASFRRGEGVHGAWIGADRKAVGKVEGVVGSGGKVGKPRAGWNGKEVAVVFADRPEGGAWQVRVGRAAGGTVPTSTNVFELPAGGPGGDAIAPDVVGLPDGRWLVMWTEGSSGKRAIRSLTLAPDFQALGDPIALSPPAGNFGQAQLAVVGGYVTVLFLQDGDEGYELWGAVLQCG